MQNWIKTLVVGSCLLTMLLHMIPNGKFVKYVRFYAGLIFVLLALQLMRALGVALPFQPVSGCTMMIECTFLSFMTVQAIRTKT